MHCSSEGGEQLCSDPVGSVYASPGVSPGNSRFAKLLSGLDSSPEHASTPNGYVKFSIQTFRTAG